MDRACISCYNFSGLEEEKLQLRSCFFAKFVKRALLSLCESIKKKLLSSKSKAGGASVFQQTISVRTDCEGGVFVVALAKHPR